MNKRKDEFEIIFTMKHLKNGSGDLSLRCNRESIKDTSLVEQLYFDVIKHVVRVVSNQITNDEYFDLEKFIEDDEKLTIKNIIDKLKEN